MTVWRAIVTVIRIRRVVVLVSVIAGGGAGFKYGPAAYHHATEARASKHESPSAASVPSPDGNTNSAGIKLCNRDLGTVSLTNCSETCLTIGKGMQCLLTPVMLDRNTVKLTVAVESRNPNGRIHDLSVAQVVTASGKSFDLAVGDFSLSLTPNVIQR